METSHRRGLLIWERLLAVPCADSPVVISRDHVRTAFTKQCQHIGGIRAVSDVIAERPDLVDRRHRCEDRLERDRVGVDIGDERDAAGAIRR
jgi:hypothetical protein